MTTIDGVGVEFGQCPLDLAERSGALLARGKPLGLCEGRAQLDLDLGGVGIGRRGTRAQLAVAVGIDERHVDTVHRGAAHQPQRAPQLAHDHLPVHVPAAVATNRLTLIAKL